jgi:sulfoxide reductase catalytic subunit YedY
MTAEWNSPEKDITPEEAVQAGRAPEPAPPSGSTNNIAPRRVWSRRKWLLATGAAAGVVAAGGGAAWWKLRGGTDTQVLNAGQVPVPPGHYYPAARNQRFAAVDRPLTDEVEAARWCNFYEFTGDKLVWRYVENFQPLPWTVEVTGLVAQPRTYDMDSLLRTFPLEERVYRHRCVEAWAMVVPWVGFPLRDLIRRAGPRPDARFVQFVSFLRPNEASRQQYGQYPWPYTEGLSLAEATNELAFLATGMYGHPLLKQHGAPVRLVVPWKYGFKSAKSIVRIELTAQQPATFWNTLSPHEYDFWANVNPEVPHPRWSQRSERMLGTNEYFDTQRYNGYGEWVAQLYRW